jgi:hypothetical protein
MMRNWIMVVGKPWEEKQHFMGFFFWQRQDKKEG